MEDCGWTIFRNTLNPWSKPLFFVGIYVGESGITYHFVGFLSSVVPKTDVATIRNSLIA